jgi:hypothetical protein
LILSFLFSSTFPPAGLIVDGVISVLDKPEPLYPAERDGTTFGGGFCASWEQTLPPFCADDAGKPLEGAAGWCKDKFCYVDPANCNITNTLTGSFRGSKEVNLHYSYETCGNDAQNIADDDAVPLNIAMFFMTFGDLFQATEFAAKIRAKTNSSSISPRDLIEGTISFGAVPYKFDTPESKRAIKFHAQAYPGMGTLLVNSTTEARCAYSACTVLNEALIRDTIRFAAQAVRDCIMAANCDTLKPADFMSMLRRTQYSGGFTGDVKITIGTNDRADEAFGLINGRDGRFAHVGEVSGHSTELDVCLPTESVDGSVQSLGTGCSALTEPPRLTGCHAQGYDALRVTWDPVAFGDQNAAQREAEALLVGYKIIALYDNQTAAWSQSLRLPKNASSHTFRLNDPAWPIHANVKYDFKIETLYTTDAESTRAALLSSVATSCNLMKSKCGSSTAASDDVPSQCVFPFKYNGKIYSKCTTIESEIPWCAWDDEYRDGRWNYCGSMCAAKLDMPCVPIADSSQGICGCGPKQVHSAGIGQGISPSTWKCLTCSPGMDCTGGTYLSLNTKAGWFVTGNVSTLGDGGFRTAQIYKCDGGSDSCRAVNVLTASISPMSIDACRAGYEGITCGACEQGYARGNNSMCVECPAGSGGGAEWGYVFAVLIAMVLAGALASVVVNKLTKLPPAEKKFKQLLAVVEARDGPAGLRRLFYSVFDDKQITKNNLAVQLGRLISVLKDKHDDDVKKPTQVISKHDIQHL